MSSKIPIMSFKIPCGGFELEEESFSLDENDVLSIQKPLTYDYMPEGYPSKSVGTVTLREEQEVAFSANGSNMFARTTVSDIKSGDKLTIIWDGVSYNVTVKTPEGAPSGALAFGNLGLIGVGDTEDYPFMGVAQGDNVDWYTADTASSHTIKVMGQKIIYTPIDSNYIPDTIQRVGDDVIIPSSTADSTKKFKITVDDSGTISATAVT